MKNLKKGSYERLNILHTEKKRGCFHRKHQKLSYFITKTPFWDFYFFTVHLQVKKSKTARNKDENKFATTNLQNNFA